MFFLILLQQVSTSTFAEIDVMELALTSDVHELSLLNFGRNLVIGEKYKVRRSDGGTEDGWQLMMFGPDGKLVLTKIASTKTHCAMLRN